MRKNLFNETFNYEQKMQNDENVLRCSEVCVYLCMSLHRVSMTVLLFTASRDWATVKNAVPGNSKSKPDQLCNEGKVQNSHQILNHSDILCIYLFVYLFIYLFIYFKS